jgi:hypothetical protein
LVEEEGSKRSARREKELAESNGRAAREYVPGGNDRGMFRVRFRSSMGESQREEEERESRKTGTRNRARKTREVG